MTASRVPVEAVLADGGDALAGLLGDFAMLDAGAPATRTWTCRDRAVVLGVSRDFHAEVERDECLRRGVAVLRRSSGGGTVAIGPGTVQWALVFRHEPATEPPSLDDAKRIANDAVRHALLAVKPGVALDSDPWGDLRVEDRKVGGLALRRQRTATLVHGTLLADADLDAIAALLKHPLHEPAWRRGRAHADFLAGVGPVDVDRFASALAGAFAASTSQAFRCRATPG